MRQQAVVSGGPLFVLNRLGSLLHLLLLLFFGLFLQRSVTFEMTRNVLMAEIAVTVPVYIGVFAKAELAIHLI